MKTKEKFEKYAILLRAQGAIVNLVAPSTLDDIETRHFADSAQLADILPKDCTIADMGSGAGFPGVVLAILGFDIICIESIGKKANFLSEMKIQLDLPNMTVFHGRLEDFIKDRKKSGKELIFTARAFAPLIKILDYTFITKSRLFLLKGREIESEIIIAKQKYDFEYDLTPSKTGDGFIMRIGKIKKIHMK